MSGHFFSPLSNVFLVLYHSILAGKRQENICFVRFLYVSSERLTFKAEFTRFITRASRWHTLSFSLFLSIVRSCSSKITESFSISYSPEKISIWVGSFCFIHPGSNRRTDHSRAVTVANIVLDNQHRADTSCSDPTTGLKSA